MIIIYKLRFLKGLESSEGKSYSSYEIQIILGRAGALPKVQGFPLSKKSQNKLIKYIKTKRISIKIIKFVDFF